jgi:hypothetical protein
MPLYSPQPDSGGAGYNIGQAGGAGNPQRETFDIPSLSTSDDTRYPWQQGHPQSKGGHHGGAHWDDGMKGEHAASSTGDDVHSRLFYEGEVAPDDLNMATDARQAAYIGIFGNNLAYAGDAPQVRNDDQGLTLNPGADKPAKAWAPGLEPPGWNDGLWQVANAEWGPVVPGQPDWRQGRIPLKAMNCAGPGEPDPWADLPPFCERPMVAFGPGEGDPYEGWAQRPMGAASGAGTDNMFLDPGRDAERRGGGTVLWSSRSWGLYPVSEVLPLPAAEAAPVRWALTVWLAVQARRGSPWPDRR